MDKASCVYIKFSIQSIHTLRRTGDAYAISILKFVRMLKLQMDRMLALTLREWLSPEKAKLKRKRLTEASSYSQSIGLREGVKDEYLRRAIELARLAASEDEKIRPKVGAVIVKEDRVIGEGYRNEDGKGGHAEDIAMRKCRGKDLEGAILVTIMEPCTKGDHRVGDIRLPCTGLIAHYKIKGVIYGMLDPNPDIRGKGIQILQENGILVDVFPPDMVKEIREINRPYIEHVYKMKGRPIMGFEYE